MTWREKEREGLRHIVQMQQAEIADLKHERDLAKAELDKAVKAYEALLMQNKDLMGRLQQAQAHNRGQM